MSAYKDGDVWRYHVRIKLPDGRRVRLKGTPAINTKAAALAAERAHIERALNPPAAPPAVVPTVQQYADLWLDKRANANASDDRTRLTLHALPHLGRMRMDEVKPRHLRDLILALRGEGKLAPRTIRQVSGLLHTMFKSAAIEEVITANPVQFERGTLPKKVDKDPTWRHEAIYTRDEIETLISDERVLPDRRILYALKSLAALRHGEAASLTWSQYDLGAKPLGSINLGHTKSGVPRQVPVHPVLAKLLASWKLSGWSSTYGRSPRADDLIVPTRNMNEDNPRGTVQQPTESQKALVADLKLLKLRYRAGQKRNRRGHDMRRTFITLARTDGAIDGLLRWVTHGPSSEMIDVYTSPPWEALCTEIAKLKIALKEGALFSLRSAAENKRWPQNVVDSTAWPTTGPQRNGSVARDAQTFVSLTAIVATPTGFEPVLPA
jgi:integrase